MLYAEAEKVLCYHGPLIYVAKILKAEKWNGDDNATHQVGPHYLVHYDGWKKTWDEWVPEARLMKYNDENLSKKAGLEAAAKAGSLTASGSESKAKDSKKSAAGAAGTAASGGSGAAGSGAGDSASERKSSTAARGTKRGREAADHDDEYIKRPEIKIPIPDVLKVQLVDDWENVTKHEQLVRLPRKPCVRDILDEYKAHYIASKKENKRSPQVLDEVLKGLKLYFDRSLGQNLLYKLERAQLAKYRIDHGPKMGDGDISSSPASPNKAGATATATPASGGAATNGGEATGDALEPSNIYGAEHLLRLFVNLPMIIVHTSMDAESTAVLKEHLAEFLAYMVKEKHRLFAREYESATASQQRLSAT